MTTVVHHGECLLVGAGVLYDPLFELAEHLLCIFEVEVGFLYDVHVFIEAVLLDVTAEHFHVILDCEEVEEALYFCVAVCILHCPADGIIVDVAEDQALTLVRGKVGHAKSFHFALHVEELVSVFVVVVFSIR